MQHPVNLAQTTPHNRVVTRPPPSLHDRQAWSCVSKHAFKPQSTSRALQYTSQHEIQGSWVQTGQAAMGLLGAQEREPTADGTAGTQQPGKRDCRARAHASHTHSTRARVRPPLLKHAVRDNHSLVRTPPLLKCCQTLLCPAICADDMRDLSSATVLPPANPRHTCCVQVQDSDMHQRQQKVILHGCNKHSNHHTTNEAHTGNPQPAQESQAVLRFRVCL